jgi:hypothetical protein
MNPSELIDEYISSITDCRGSMLAKLCRLVREVDLELEEEWKWNSPVWSHNGNVCSVSAFKNHVGMNFFHGASLADPHGLFNGGLDSKKSRSIHLREDEGINGEALKELLRAAVRYNRSRGK